MSPGQGGRRGGGAAHSADKGAEPMAPLPGSCRLQRRPRAAHRPPARGAGPAPLRLPPSRHQAAARRREGPPGHGTAGVSEPRRGKRSGRPGGRPPRGGAAARSPRRDRSETHAVRRSRSARRAPSVPLRPPRYLWRGAPSRRQLEPGRGRAVTGGARGQWAPPSGRRGPMGRP